MCFATQFGDLFDDLLGYVIRSDRNAPSHVISPNLSGEHQALIPVPDDDQLGCEAQCVASIGEIKVVVQYSSIGQRHGILNQAALAQNEDLRRPPTAIDGDRKRVVSGKRVSVRVDLGG